VATERYEPRLDVGQIAALDVHVHIEIDDEGNASLPPALA
jgi:hypothetical protein